MYISYTKQNRMKRTKCITVRLTDNEKKKISQKAEQLGLDLSTYMRAASLGGIYNPTVNYEHLRNIPITYNLLELLFGKPKSKKKGDYSYCQFKSNGSSFNFYTYNNFDCNIYNLYDLALNYKRRFKTDLPNLDRINMEWDKYNG
jgi:hypothetical protein